LTFAGSNLIAKAQSRTTAVSYSGYVSASDLVDGTITPTCSPSSGSIFPLGTTKVTCTAKDASGNTQSGSFQIVVQDTTPPDLSIPSTTITAEATSPRGAAVSYLVSALDLVSGSIRPVCTTNSGTVVVSSGSVFPLGTTKVTCTAKDASGNTQSGSFQIVVQDTTPPTLTFAGSNLIAKAQSRTTAVSYSGYVSASDLVDGTITPTCSPSSGSMFPVGVTTVKCTASDRDGNAVSESFTITVRYPIFSGFLAPINADGSSVFKLGSVVPVKFQLKWPDGGYVSDAKVQLYSAKISNSITGTVIASTGSDASSSASTGNEFTYDSSKNQYVFNLQTKNLSVGTWQIRLLLDDGSSPSVNISLRN
ncbi:MAG TPA: HYR domain-containing protein, partial [Nitrososphaeraceae archaeon]